MDTTLNSNSSSNNDHHIFVKRYSHLQKINSDDILWIEALGDYVVINTSTKKFTVHTTMKSIEQKLPSDKFKRVHRSYIVPVGKINAIEGQTLEVGKKLIPVSRSYKKMLLSFLNLL